jgi:hypothetical protein
MRAVAHDVLERAVELGVDRRCRYAEAARHDPVPVADCAPRVVPAEIFLGRLGVVFYVRMSGLRESLDRIDRRRGRAGGVATYEFSPAPKNW